MLAGPFRGSHGKDEKDEEVQPFLVAARRDSSVGGGRLQIVELRMRHRWPWGRSSARRHSGPDRLGWCDDVSTECRWLELRGHAGHVVGHVGECAIGCSAGHVVGYDAGRVVRYAGRAAVCAFGKLAVFGTGPVLGRGRLPLRAYGLIAAWS